MIFDHNRSMLFNEACWHLGGDKATGLFLSCSTLHKNTRYVDLEPLVTMRDVKMRQVSPFLGPIDELSVGTDCLGPDDGKCALIGTNAKLVFVSIPYERAGRNAVAPIGESMWHTGKAIDQTLVIRYTRRQPRGSRVRWHDEATSMSDPRRRIGGNIKVVDLGSAHLSSLSVGCEQRRLQHVFEDAFPRVDEVRRKRGCFGGEKRTQALEVFAGQEARRGNVGNDAGWLGPPHGDVCEQAVKIRVTEKTPCKITTLRGCQGNAAVRRIANNDIEQCVGGFTGERVTHLYQFRQASANLCENV